MKLVQQFLVGGFDENCTYICIEPTTKQAVIVDPAGNLTSIHQFIHTNSCTLNAIWLTHTHADHTEGISEIHHAYGQLPIYVHAAGLENLHTYKAIHPIHDQDILMIGEQAWEVWHTPGHSPDSVCFWHYNTTDTEQSELLSGDTLFVHGCGRTTRADALTLFQSLQRIASLPAHTTIYPGHNYGPSTTSTLDHERIHNPYLKSPDLETFLVARFPEP